MALVHSPVLAAIDVGTNAIRLELARPLSDGNLEILHQERDPVRPGEGLFRTGTMGPDVVDRVMSTLRRYGALCRRYNAKVRAVATSAVREARNRDEVLRRARRDAGLRLEVISGKEEARLVCLGVLHGSPPRKQSLCLDVGGGSTELASAVGERPTNLWSIALGAVRLTELFEATAAIDKGKLKLMREYAREVVKEALPLRNGSLPRVALGSSGSARVVIGFAASEGTVRATPRQLTRAVNRLVEMGAERRRRHFDPRRADIIVAGAVILESVAHHLSLEAITAVERGLRHGVLIDLQRSGARGADPSVSDAALALGRRFEFDETHGKQVCRLALALFDGMSHLANLPPSGRRLLEAAALLHDIGQAVNHQRHHRHTQYLIENADIPGLSDSDRILVSRIARYHRRSQPMASDQALSAFSTADFRMVRKLSTILRVADSLDRSHMHHVRQLSVAQRRNDLVIKVKSVGAVDLELWDVAHELPLFRQVFGKGLKIETTR